MASLPTELKSTTTVRFQDCDPFGHLNNARFIDYFINTRSDQLAQYYDFHIFEYGTTPRESWVVSQTQIAYLAPAQLMEPVTIVTRLIDATERSLLVEGCMLDAHETHLKSVCWIKFAYVSLANGKLATHSPELMDFFNQIRVTVDGSIFEGRVKAIHSLYRVKGDKS